MSQDLVLIAHPSTGRDVSRHATPRFFATKTIPQLTDQLTTSMLLVTVSKQPRWALRMRRFVQVLLLGPLILAACGAVPPVTGSVASSSRTASPSPPPAGAPNAFLPGDCTYPEAGGTLTQPARDTFRTVISVPPGWTQKDRSWSESTVYELAAPSTYPNAPTTIDIVIVFPDTPHHSPAQYLAGITQASYTVVGQIETCTVDGDSAAYLYYTLPSRPGFQGSRAGYMVLWIHFAVAYELRLEGSQGVDRKSIQDAKGVLASISWTSNTPPPQYTPSDSP